MGLIITIARIDVASTLLFPTDIFLWGVGGPYRNPCGKSLGIRIILVVQKE